MVQRVLAAETARSNELAQLIKLHSYWKKITSDFPTYRDGFVQLAVVDAQLGDEVSSKKDIQHVFTLDPNFQLPASLR